MFNMQLATICCICNDMLHAICNMQQHTTCSNMQHATCGMKDVICSMLPATCNRRHATTCSVQHATCNDMQLATTCSMQHAACTWNTATFWPCLFWSLLVCSYFFASHHHFASSLCARDFTRVFSDVQLLFLVHRVHVACALDQCVRHLGGLDRREAGQEGEAA